MKHVLHIGKYYPPYFGGIEKVEYDLVESLNKKGYKTDVLCFNHKSGELIENKGYKIIRATTLTTAFSSPISLTIFKILKKVHHDYDIIHLHLPNPIGALALQLVPFKGKIVVHWHSDIVKQSFLKIFYKPLQDKLLKKADRIIVTSSNYLEGSSDLTLFKEKCTIIPIGISNSEFPKNESFGSALIDKYKNKKIIFSIGRLIYYKGFKYLIDAAKGLPNDCVVLIGGTGTLAADLQNQINENKLQEKVILLGKIPIEHLGEYYKNAAIYCLPSTERSEAFGVVLIEAMSFGCPIVSSDIPGSGVSWINIHNETGLIVESKNPEELTKALINILNNGSLRNKFANNALKRYQVEFQLELMTERTIKLYESLFI